MGELRPQHWPETLESPFQGWGPNLLSQATSSSTPTPAPEADLSDLSASVSASFASHPCSSSHLPWPSTRQPTGQHCTPSPALEQVPEAMGMCRGFGGAEKAREVHTTTPLSRCPLWGVRDSRLSPGAQTRPF